MEGSGFELTSGHHDLSLSPDQMFLKSMVIVKLGKSIRQFVKTG